MIVVSDSCPLIALSRLSMLSVLQELFGEIVIQEEVLRSERLGFGVITGMNIRERAEAYLENGLTENGFICELN